MASPGKLLLSADYSQVELRILAHFSEDPTMLKSFNDGVDIHAQTASEVLGIDVNNVSAEDRSKAKAVNFGLMYGQSSFGLSKVLRISRKEAKAITGGGFTKQRDADLAPILSLCANMGGCGERLKLTEGHSEFWLLAAL